MNNINQQFFSDQRAMLKRSILLLPLFLFFFTSSFSQLITIAGSPGTSGNTPMGQNLNSAVESIYTQAEINTVLNINRLNYSCATLSTGSNVYNNFAIYMKLTTATTLATGTYSLVGYTLVYNGPIGWNATGYNGVNLTTTFNFPNTPGQHLQILTVRTDNLAHPGNVFNCALGNSTAGSAALTSRRYFSSAIPAPGVTSLTQTNFRPAIQVGEVFPNDVGVVNIYTLGKLPIEYGAPTVIQALIRNEGTNPMTNIDVELAINGSNSFSDLINIPLLAAGASTVLSFAPYSPTNLSVADQVTVTLSALGDQNAVNDTKDWFQDVTQNLYSYKNQAVPNTGGVGFNGGTGDFVAKFNSNPGITPPYTNPPEINEIKVDLTTSGQSYQLGIWNANGVGGIPGTLLWQSPVLTSAVGTAFVPVPNVSVSGDYFVGVRQIGTTNIGFGYQSENPIRAQTFYFTSPTGSTTWTDFAPNSPFRFSIEVQVRIPQPPSCALAYVPANGSSITCTTPVLSWQSGGGAPTGYDVYLSANSADVVSENPLFKVATNQPGNSYTPSGLASNTTYYWKVVPLNIDGSATGCPTESFTTGSLPNCYCIPSYTGTLCTAAITNLTFNTLSNISTCSPPAHTIYPATGSLTTSVEQGGSYPLSIIVNDTNIVSVWIDYNQNGTFEASEWQQITTTGSANVASSALINVPATASLGNTLMRVRSRIANNVNGSGDACTSFGSGESEDYVVTIVVPTPCSGSPAPGNTIASATSVCNGNTVNFSLQFPTNGTGVTYQWYNNGGAIAGATNITYSQVFTVSDDVYCDVTCAANTGSSNIVSVTLNNFYDCYCSSTATSTLDEEIYNVTLNGASTNTTYAGANSCITVAPGQASVLSQYSNFKGLGALTSVTAGNAYAFTVQEDECDGAPYYNFGTAIWIDFNQNGSFADPGEQVFVEATAAIGPRNVTGSINIPGTATPGLTGMRVIVAEGFAGAQLTPCLGYGFGETEDYLIDILPATPCAGTPAPGNTIASASTVCSGTTVNFSLQNPTNGSGVTYQWYNGAGAIAGATGLAYSQVITAADSFYCLVTCTNSSQTGTSVAATVTLNSPFNCYCAAGANIIGCTSGDEYIGNVTLNTINNTSTCPPSGQYSDFTSISTNLTQGSTYTISVLNPNWFSGDQVSAWIDLNQDGILDDVTEKIDLTIGGTSASVPFETTFIVPPTALTGPTRLRIRLNFTGAMSSCGITTWGEVEDYTVVIDPVVTSTTLNLTCYIQSYWVGSNSMQPTLSNQFQSNPTTDCDTITVQLMDATTYTVSYSTTAVLQTNGTAACVFPSGVTPGVYYIAVTHRNALETWSALPEAISGPIASYNFSTASTQAYGGNQVEVATGVWAFYSGDVVKDFGQSIDLLDLGQIELEINNFSFGYFSEDINGDGNVDILDTPEVEPNVSNFVFSQHP